MAKLTLILPLLSTILTLASSAPTGFTFPLSNGFPNPDQSQLTTIEQQAHGTLPNTPPPTSLDPESETALAFIAFNELFEVAFFTELIANITSNAAGYTDIPNQAQVLKTLNAVVAQEQLHELSANDAFTTLTGAPIQPCTYAFPVDTFNASIALASQFTDLSLGLLSDVQTIFAAHNDSAALIRLISAIVGQEGEQNGFYRSLLNEIPPALPFLTAGALDFSFNVILQNFVVPGSCPSLDLLVSRGLKQFGVLKVLTTNFTADKDSTGEFSIASYYPAEKRQEGSSNSTSQAFLTYINQQNAPFSVPMTMTKNDGGAVLFFNASFPAETKNLSGLVVAAVTNGDGPFAGPEEVAAATLFGPGFIDVEA